jgi:beta-glucosidase
MRHLLSVALLVVVTVVTSIAAPATSDRDFHITTTPYPQLQLQVPGKSGNRYGGWWKPRFEQKCALAQQGGFEVMFVGDSITHAIDDGKDGGVFKAMLVPATIGNFGYSGDRTENVLWRLDHGELAGNIAPKVIMVMIGTNNTGQRMDPPAEIAAGVEAIVGRLAPRFPKARIILLDIFPRGAVATDPMRLNNIAANAIIAKLDGSAGGRVKYFPIGDKFLDATGNLPKELMPDLLHPNAAGYKIWAEAVVPEIKMMLGN